ncbi:hypothetical protein K378_03921 [Streptomyces sp. Amel2xB2]|uniref:hypothetical protein n=1 Tax=Streptomyces sp. Amel2xB2 TaxID=1305829 RepID=UPI000DBAC5C9|nr:hypothetical protein [Streptomyces sp. Amel2xB2]RAJ62568.1 hypothetical protein K378_03921 [Streptomyces sp. Amel2xB2]
MSDCPYCGWPDDEPVQGVSRHPTAEGVLAWTRCACGSLQARVLTGGTVRIVTRGKPADGRPQDERRGAAR